MVIEDKSLKITVKLIWQALSVCALAYYRLVYHLFCLFFGGGGSRNLLTKNLPSKFSTNISYRKWKGEEFINVLKNCLHLAHSKWARSECNTTEQFGP